jgi:outer membrane protein OmpU
MNNLKKIGLTALGTALVTAGSAQAASMSVSASTSIFFGGKDNVDQGNGWSMTDSLTFTGSGEMDNGFTISTTLELDSGSATYDDRSISIDTGDMGKLTFSGSGTSGPLGAWDDLTPSANEESWGTAVAGTIGTPGSAASNANSFVYDYTVSDAIAIKAAYHPSNLATAVDSSTEIGAVYTGIDGLTISAGMGENNDAAAGTDVTVFSANYALGAITVGYQANEMDSSTASTDEDFTAMGISYAVSDDMSVSYGVSTLDYEDSTKEDQDSSAVSVSYTSGGLTISASHQNTDNVGGSASADNSGYEVNFSFAF